MLASLLETICSAVSCGAPAWVSTAACCCCCLAAFAALLPFAGFDVSPCLEGSPCLEASPCLASFAAGACPPLLLLPPVRTPVTPVTTPTTPPMAPPSTPPTGPAALLPSRTPFLTPSTTCASTNCDAPSNMTAAAPRTAHHLSRARSLDVGLVI